MNTQKLEFNPLVHEKLRENNIQAGFDENEALLLLLSIYYNIPTLCFSEIIIKKVNLTKIVERDYDAFNKTHDTFKPKWNIPLFADNTIQQIDTNWEWVNTEYRVLFGELRIDAKGDSTGCITKMKKFFSLHPEVRKEDIITAAEMYIAPFKQRQQDKKYMVRADYFISKVVDGGKVSRLEQYLEQAKEFNKVNKGKNIRFTVVT